MHRRRIDAELVRRGLARSRTEAGRLIAAGRVRLDGAAVAKPATLMDPAQALLLAPESADPGYASRGGLKLAGALDALGQQGPTVAGARALDAGASTGGFTDVLLRRGAAHVTAVDVGYGQLAWRLQADPRVTVMDRTNVRHLAPGDIDPPPTLVTADLSFISLVTVIPALAGAAAPGPGAEFLLMVKPQFEVGKDALPRGGVVRDPAARAAAVQRVLDAAADCGLHPRGVARSPLPGPSGNVEFFIHLARTAQGALAPAEASAAIVRETAAEGSAA
jgi:23S rRNA (cytidine1920-2'-O)/16S rRNA (cytidine1409-2'-O)-methyltransferase